jgi:hypothetical protein
VAFLPKASFPYHSVSKVHSHGTWISAPFLFMAEYYSIGWTCHGLLPKVDVGLLPLLVVISAAVSMCFLGPCFQFFACVGAVAEPEGLKHARHALHH